MKSKYFSSKTYIFIALGALFALFLILYALGWYRVYQKEQTRESYLITSNTISMQITDLEDLNTILSEAADDYFLYISYTNSVDVLNLEKKLKKVIDNYGLNDIIYYIDVTKHKDDLDKLNENLGIDKNLIQKVPTIVYVKSGKIESQNIITPSKNKMMSAKDFENLLKKNEIEKISQ